MKKVLFSIAILAVAFGFTACSNEDEALSNVKGGKTTVLAMTEVGTRTALKSDGAGAYNVVWSKGDKIYISDGHSQYKEFTLKSGAGETTATFEGETPADGEYYAFYATMFETFESTQYYEAGKVCNFPMCASATVEDGKIKPLEFWNMGGMLSLTVKGTAKIKNIKITSEQRMSGSISVNKSERTATGSYDIKYVQLDCGDGVALTAAGTVFNIALLANDYTGVAITLTDTDGNTCTKTFKGTALKIERSKITKASFTANIVPATTGKAYAKGPDCDVNWVQLWKGGPKFAEYNVGATSATEIGGYYTWGGTYKNGTGITWDGTYNTTNDGTENLAIADDTAHKLWGNNWRMPTEEEFQALIDNCDAEWTDDYDNSGLAGTIYTGKDNYSENSIFIPVAGLCEEGAVRDIDINDNCVAYYWSSTPYTSEGALFLCFDKKGADMDITARESGFPIRPVLNETK